MSKFNFKSQICTDRFQSERLLSLGLKKETADCRWTCVVKDSRGKDIPKNEQMWFLRLSESENYQTCGFSRTEFLPAWSLNRLIEMMPFDVIPEGGFDNCFTLIKNYPKGYSVEYDGFSYYYKESIYDTLIDAIEHLIKEGYFNKEYLV